jgi:hypothetical protein
VCRIAQLGVSIHVSVYDKVFAFCSFAVVANEVRNLAVLSTKAPTNAGCQDDSGVG